MSSKKLLGAVFLVSVLIMLAVSTTSAVSTTLVIGEVLYDPAGTEPGGEWFELHNLSADLVDLSVYEFSDGEAVYQFPAGATLGPDQTIVVANNATTFSTAYGFAPDYDLSELTKISGTSFGLANDADELILSDETAEVDTVAWGSGDYNGVPRFADVAEGHSIRRVPLNNDTDDFVADFVDEAAPTPHRTRTVGSGGDYATIQAAINAANPGDTITIEAGTYPETLDIPKDLTLIGAGQADVTIDTSAFSDYGVHVGGDYEVTLRDLTIIGPAPADFGYGLKIAGDDARAIIRNVTVQNSGRSGIDLNGLSYALLENITATDNGGVGLALSDCSNVTVTNLTTSGNPWGGAALYVYGHYYTGGSDNVTFAGTTSLAEAPALTLEATAGSGFFLDDITNLTLPPELGYVVQFTGYDTMRADYTNTQADAFTVVNTFGAIDPALLPLAYVRELTTGDFYVASGMSIQTAINTAASGDTINIKPGAFTENITVDKQLTIAGAGNGDDPAVDTILQKETTASVVRVTGSGTADTPILFTNMRVVPEGVNGFEVPNAVSVSHLTLDGVNVVGPQPRTIENENGFKVATDGSLFHLEIIDSAFEYLDYGWYFAKHGDWGPDGSMVQDVDVSNTRFANNDYKALYVEKLSDAVFTDVEVTDNGSSTFWNDTWNGGIDINLKGEEAYQNLTFNNLTVTGNGLGFKEGAGVMIKARDDGATYGAHPATLANVAINGGTFSGNERGIRFGEPGKNNATPTNVTVHNANISGNAQTYAGTDGSVYGGVINHTPSTVAATENWWGDAGGPGGEGPGSGDAVTTSVLYCPWLTGAAPGGAVLTRQATTSADGHTARYCTIAAAIEASDGANQEVWVSEGDWPAENVLGDYSDSPDLLVKATGATANTVVNGLRLTGAVFDGLTFNGFTFAGSHPDGHGNYAVKIDGDGNYANLALVNNSFDGQNIEDMGAIFFNRGWDGFLLDNNTFQNYNESPLTPIDEQYYANYSLVFAEAQDFTPEGRGNNFVATNNTFNDIRHLNALEAFRWQNVTMTGNNVTGTFGRLLVWSYSSDPLLNVTIQDNTVDISAGNDVAASTGIGVYYADATVNISGNTVTGASSCLSTSGVTDLTVTGNTLNQCDTRGLYFSDSDGYVAPVSALIEDNTFDTGPAGVENTATEFELNVCQNTFTNIDTPKFSNPGPFANCRPVALDDTFTVAEDTVDNLFDVLGNDTSFPDITEVLTITTVGSPDTGGTATTDGAEITYTPAPDVTGSETFTYTIIDGNNGQATAAVTVTLTPVNDAPVLDPIADQIVDEGTTLTFTVTATDTDPLDTLTYSATSLPTGAAINPDTGEFSWTPAEADGPGVYTVTFIVSDSGTPVLSDSQKATLTVNETNVAPTFTSTPPTNQVNVAEPYAYNITISDPDPNDTLVITTTLALPAWLSLTDYGDGSALLGGTPPLESAGVYTITLQASDGAENATQEVVINVVDPAAGEDAYRYFFPLIFKAADSQDQ